MNKSKKEYLSAFLDGESNEIEIHHLSRALAKDEPLSELWVQYMAIRKSGSQTIDCLSSEQELKLYRSISAELESEDSFSEKLHERKSGAMGWVGLAVAASAFVFSLVFLIELPKEDSLVSSDDPSGLHDRKISEAASNNESPDPFVVSPELLELDEKKRERLRAYLNQHDRMVQMGSEGKFVHFKDREKK